MISLETFIERCGKLIQERKPFIAYWHENGYAFLRTGVIEYTEYTIDYEEPGRFGVGIRRAETTDEDMKNRLVKYCKGRIVNQKKAKKKTKGSTVKAFRKEVTKMEKDWRTMWNLRSVEFNENGLVVKGEGLDALYAIPVPRDGDSVGP